MYEIGPFLGLVPSKSRQTEDTEKDKKNKGLGTTFTLHVACCWSY